MTKQTVMVFIFIAMEPSTRDTGRMICKMVMENKYGQMEVNMKACTKMVKNMVMAHIYGQMEVNIRVIG